MTRPTVLTLADLIGEARRLGATPENTVIVLDGEALYGNDEYLHIYREAGQVKVCIVTEDGDEDGWEALP